MSTFKDTSHDELLTNIKNYKKKLTLSLAAVFCFHASAEDEFTWGMSIGYEKIVIDFVKELINNQNSDPQELPKP